MKSIKTIVLGVALMAVFGFSAAAQTPANRSYYVRADGDDANNNGRSEEAPYKTLKKAVEMATQGAVKTITVIGTLDKKSEGTSQVTCISIRIDKGQELLITGKADASEAERAILSGSGTNMRVIEVGVIGKVTFENIEISGGNQGNGHGGGMSIYGSGNVTLGKGVKIINNKASYGGGGLLIRDGSIVTLAGAEISGNIASGNYNAGGGGIMVSGQSSLIINDAKIENNTANDVGGGIMYQGSAGGDGKFEINGGTITENTSKKNGGGIYVNSGTFAMTNGNILNNNAKQGGGIYVRPYKATVSGGTVKDNTAEYGAGVYLENVRNCSLTLSGGTITENTAEFVGGGLYIQTGATYTAKGGKIEKNEAGDGEGLDIFKQ
jgi:predicted outer membrane repeat protein